MNSDLYRQVNISRLLCYLAENNDNKLMLIFRSLPYLFLKQKIGILGVPVYCTFENFLKLKEN